MAISLLGINGGTCCPALTAPLINGGRYYFARDCTLMLCWSQFLPCDGQSGTDYTALDGSGGQSWDPAWGSTSSHGFSCGLTTGQGVFDCIGNYKSPGSTIFWNLKNTGRLGRWRVRIYGSCSGGRIKLCYSGCQSNINLLPNHSWPSPVTFSLPTCDSLEVTW